MLVCDFGKIDIKSSYIVDSDRVSALREKVLHLDSKQPGNETITSMKLSCYDEFEINVSDMQAFLSKGSQWRDTEKKKLVSNLVPNYLLKPFGVSCRVSRFVQFFYYFFFLLLFAT